MIIDASSKIAVKCSHCGKYTLTEIDLFKLKNKADKMCECRNKLYSIQYKKGEILLDVSCIACEIEHHYKFKLRDLLEKPLNIISCPVSGMEIAFLGNNDYVENVVERYRNDVLELLKALGIV